MSRNALLIIVLSAVVVGAIKFSGKCPKAPVKMNVTDDGFWESKSLLNPIYVSALDTVNRSYVFNPFWETYNFYITLSFPSGVIIFEDRDSPYQVESVPVRKSDSVSMISTVYKKKYSEREALQCHQPIEEDFVVWTDGDYTFMWTCLDYGQDRDEAVIILSHYFNRYLDDVRLNKVWLKIKIVAKKYLSPDLIQSIDQSHMENKRKDDNFFRCPVAGEKQTREGSVKDQGPPISVSPYLLATIVAVILILAILLTVLLNMKKQAE